MLRNCPNIRWYKSVYPCKTPHIFQYLLVFYDDDDKNEFRKEKLEDGTEQKYADQLCLLMGKVCETNALVNFVKQENEMAKKEMKKTNEIAQKNAVATKTELENRLKKIEAMLEKIQVGNNTLKDKNDETWFNVSSTSALKNWDML